MQRASDLASDIVLQREKVACVAVVPVGPQLRAVTRVEQFGGNAHPIAESSDAPFDDGADDVGMLQLRDEPDFPGESLDGRRCIAAVEHLDDHLASERELRREIDAGHPASTEFAVEAVAGGQRGRKVVGEGHRS